MKPVYQWNPFRVGLAAIAALGVLGLAIVLLGAASFGTSSYQVQLVQTGGLRAAESVKVDGVNVGEVKSLQLVDDHVLVDIVVDNEIDLGAQTRADVKVSTLLGTHYLQLTPAGGGSLPDGTIPLAQTGVPFNLEDVIEEGTKALNEIDGVRIAKALTEMSKTLDASGDEVGPVLSGVGRLSDVVARRSNQIGELAKAAKGVTDQLHANSSDIVGLMEQANLVISEVTARRAAIHRLLVETTSLSRSLTGIVNETKDDLRPALININTALEALNREKKTLTRVISLMAPTARYIANATGHGPWAEIYVDYPVMPADDQCQQTPVLCTVSGALR